MAKVKHSVVSFNDSEYVLRKFSDTVTVEDVMDSFVYVINNKMISSKCKGILTDLREADLKFDMNSFKNLIIYIKSNPSLVDMRIAVVVDSASKIVFPMMASKDTEMMVQPFSTMDAARDWILQ